MASLFGRDNLPAPDRAPETGAQDPQAEMLLTGQQLAAQSNDGNEQDVTTAAMHAECTRSTDADVPRSGRSSWDAPREADGAFQGRDQHFAQNATEEKKNSSEGEGEKLPGQILSSDSFSGEDFFSENFSMLTKKRCCRMACTQA